MRPPAASPGSKPSAVDAAKRAAAAAAAALSHAAPGQRERVINEAMSSVVKSGGQAKEKDSANMFASHAADLGAAVVADGAYQPPSWAQPYPTEDNDEISLDVIKTGTVLGSLPLRPTQAHFTFGRHPQADFMVEHASTSRLHAVLQFRGREAFLVDCGSTHGTFLNKRQLRPLLYHPVPVGSMFRLGQSTRCYIFNAPPVRPLPSLRTRRVGTGRAEVMVAQHVLVRRWSLVLMSTCP